ncbi:hypothetical protein NLJ89_g8433 [Agrocybe chaxingu]|uniref:Uncharacterized protein n=1 Tax=Agrocybe chaxingu TaxID=84603 RepID=A0A9W8JV98_9AGAR|nr:hypothetical protein NLJ89_g8433 [Agrocybe chaxingu]
MSQRSSRFLRMRCPEKDIQNVSTPEAAATTSCYGASYVKAYGVQRSRLSRRFLWGVSKGKREVYAKVYGVQRSHLSRRFLRGVSKGKREVLVQAALQGHLRTETPLDRPGISKNTSTIWKACYRPTARYTNSPQLSTSIPCTDTSNNMHITPPTSPSEQSSSNGAAPPPPGSVGRVDAPVVPVMPNVASAPAAVADGVFLPSSAHRATTESDGTGPTGSAIELTLPAPYIARSPMRATPATPTRRAMDFLRLGVPAARLVRIEAALRLRASVPIQPASLVGTAPSALRPQTPLPSSSTASPGAGPSTSCPLSTPTQPQTQQPDSSALRLRQIRAALSPQPEEHTYEDAPDPFVVTPGRPGNPIYIPSGTTPNGTPTPIQPIAVPAQPVAAPAQQTNRAANREHVSVAVQTDPVYVLSRFSTPEPFFHFSTPSTHSSPDTRSSTRRPREDSEGDDEQESERPSLRRRIEEIFACMESPPPSPPGPSLARTRIRPRGKKHSYRTERPDEFGPAYRVKVLDSSDEEYKPFPSFPQGPSNYADAHMDEMDPAPSTPVASGSRLGPAASISGALTPCIDDDNAQDSDSYPDMFDFDDAAINAELDRALESAERKLEEERQKTDGKGKEVAR